MESTSKATLDATKGDFGHGETIIWPHQLCDNPSNCNKMSQHTPLTSCMPFCRLVAMSVELWCVDRTW